MSMLPPIDHLFSELGGLMSGDVDCVLGVAEAVEILLLASLGTNNEDVINRVSEIVTNDQGTTEEKRDALKRALAFLHKYFHNPICVIAPDAREDFLNELYITCPNVEYFDDFNMAAINDFISQKTNGMMKDFLQKKPEGHLNMMVLACACLQARWASPLTKVSNAYGCNVPFEFTRLDGAKVEYPTTLTCKPPYFLNAATVQGCAMRLKMNDSDLPCYGIFIKPSRDNIGVNFGEAINKIFNSPNERGGKVTFPAFKVKTKMDLRKKLTPGQDHVQMTRVSPSSVLTGLRLTTEITVDEKGTSAAGAAELEVTTRCISPTMALNTRFFYVVGVFIGDEFVPMYLTSINGTPEGVATPGDTTTGGDNSNLTRGLTVSRGRGAAFGDADTLRSQAFGRGRGAAFGDADTLRSQAFGRGRGVPERTTQGFY